ncbi:hypothetical protein BDR03DRAFT_996796, partial [Suillus americanus]
MQRCTICRREPGTDSAATSCVFVLAVGQYLTAGKTISFGVDSLSVLLSLFQCQVENLSGIPPLPSRRTHRSLYTWVDLPLTRRAPTPAAWSDFVALRMKGNEPHTCGSRNFAPTLPRSFTVVKASFVWDSGRRAAEKNQPTGIALGSRHEWIIERREANSTNNPQQPSPTIVYCWRLWDRKIASDTSQSSADFQVCDINVFSTSWNKIGVIKPPLIALIVIEDARCIWGWKRGDRPVKKTVWSVVEIGSLEVAFNFLGGETPGRKVNKEVVIRIGRRGPDIGDMLCAALNHLGCGRVQIVGFSKKSQYVRLRVIDQHIGYRSGVVVRGGSLKCPVARFVTRIRGFIFDVQDGRSPREHLQTSDQGVYRAAGSRKSDARIGRLTIGERERLHMSGRVGGFRKRRMADVISWLVTRISGRSSEGQRGSSRVPSEAVVQNDCPRDSNVSAFIRKRLTVVISIRGIIVVTREPLESITGAVARRQWCSKFK